MKKLFVIIMILCFMISGVFAGAKKFKKDDYKDIKKAAKKLVKMKMKAFKKENIKRLVILECFGEYVTSKEITASVADQRSAMRSAASRGSYFYTVKTKVDTIEFDKDYYTNTSNRVYQAVKEAFAANGIEIVSKDELKKCDEYIKFNLKEEKSGRGVTSGMYKPTIVEKSQKVSANGLGIFPTSPLKRIKLVMDLGKITASVKADGFLQINFKVDKGKKSRPVLDKFDVLLSSDLRTQKVGFGKKKVRYDFHNQWQPIVTLKSELMADEDVLDGKKGPLNVKKYDDALMGMLYTLTDAIKFGLSSK